LAIVANCRATALLLTGLALFGPLIVCAVSKATENQAGQNQAGQNQAANAVAELVAAADIPADLRAAMLATLAASTAGRQGDERVALSRQWSGSTRDRRVPAPHKTNGAKSDTTNKPDKPDRPDTAANSNKGDTSYDRDEWLFGLAARTLPDGQLRVRATPLLLSTAQALAIHEMLTAQAVLDVYGPQGLTDLPALRQAILKAAGELRVTGRVRGTLYQAESRGGFATSFVAGRRDTLTAFLREPPASKLVHAAYGEVLTGRTRELAKQREWDQALTFVAHLEKLDLQTGPLLLDAARCHEARGAADRALAALKRARKIEDARAGVDFLTELGDIALRLGGDDAQVVAEEAFTEALRRFRNR
jgi:hypothetical protein